MRHPDVLTAKSIRAEDVLPLSTARGQQSALSLSSKLELLTLTYICILTNAFRLEYCRLRCLYMETSHISHPMGP